ncbi:methyl-accepting chemotaxis protein [Oceanospirillum sediminis]|uniref:Methyl-accepting chemotaxis protein n=1 Tax=Oceanospirillum sediminis TaxID=2760088 RepID=A0A839ITS2_9GAMM|nr:methyl-accepting chemotaxis protein [Oceanospirillum sediminis]MBB1487516.1 methyl-accepting chemotaxis protein [Oceanospirillum sediminis]
MLIRHKLILNTAIAMGAMAVMYSLFTFTLNKVDDLNTGKVFALKLEADMLQLRRDEKDFLARKDTAYQQKFDQKIELMQADQKTLQDILERYELVVRELPELQRIVLDYQQRFHEVVDAVVEMGVDPESGLTGDLRQAVHAIESELKKNEADSVLVTMLQLRRAEKDFMLRSDLKYQDRFKKLIAKLNQQIAMLPVSNEEKQRLSDLSSQYSQKFMAYIAGAQRLGLSSKEGLRMAMRSTVHKTEALLAKTFGQVQLMLKSSIDRARLISILVFSGMLILSSVTAWLIARSVFNPIKAIQGSIMDIHQSHDLSLRVKEQGRDEITEMAKALNQMLTSFQNVIIRVNHAVDKMNHSTGELSENAGRTANDMDRQLAETDQVTSSVTEMVSTIEEIALNTENTAMKANATHNNAKDGQEKVQQAIDSIRVLSDQLEGSGQTVSDLSEQSETIGSVLEVIQGIAEQTNLLALNAAIEAARAGEQGRGFAVVADEVRALAGRTQEATQEIAVIIGSLQEKTQSIVRLMGQCRQRGSESREQAAQAESVLIAITGDVTEISDMATQIATAIEQQSCVANEVGQNVTVIRDITIDASAAVQKNSQASDDISAQAGELKQAVSIFRV